MEARHPSHSNNYLSWLVFWNNLINGDFNYYLAFGKISDKGMNNSLPISNSNSVPIKTALFDADGGWKYCESKIITDETIDFYQGLDL